MDSFDGLLPALVSLLSNNNHRARARGSSLQPHNLPARSPCLDLAASAASSSADAHWKLLRQSSINSISDSARGCLAGLPFWRPPAAAPAGGGTGHYAKLRSKIAERKVLLSSALINTTTNHHHHHAIHAASHGDSYQTLAGHP